MRRTRASWSDISSGQRATLVGAGAVQLALLVGALSDLRRRSSAELNGSKALWVAVSFVNFVGPLA